MKFPSPGFITNWTDGDAKQEVCYWGDHAFFPHIINLLGKKSVRATLRFGKFQPHDR